MAARLGMRDDVLRRIARRDGIAIPADEIISKSRHRDSSHIIRETAQALEGLAMGVGLVSLADLDPVEAQAWATSLTSSIQTLSQFTSKIKEMTQ